ncbi:MAG: hypothetical protein ACPGD5_06535 [Salibacteraceae bacterium]
MKKSLSSLLIVLFLVNFTFAQKTKCSRISNFGSAEICLPKIKGYQECYTYPRVGQLADATEVPANMVLGFYLNNGIYERKDSLGLISFDDYFKVYGTKQIKDYPADNALLKKMQEIMSGNFLTKNWDELSKEVDKIGLEIEIGVPTIIKSYNLNKNSFTYITLTNYSMEGGNPVTLVMTMSGVLVNERLIWMAYYLNYNGEETIERAEKNSNFIVTNLLKSAN